MNESYMLSATFHVDPAELFQGWLDSEMHAAFTGSPARIDPRPGGAFSVWDGYISGTTLEIQPPRRIMQSWRTTEFPADKPDSLLEVLFEKVPDGTKLTLKHSRVPAGQAEMYQQGWEEYYFTPMRIYFG